MLKFFESYLGHILDLYCIWLSNASLFWENYAKLYFDARDLEKGLNSGEGGNFFQRSAYFIKKVFFFIESALSGQYQSYPKFLEYALLVLSVNCLKFVFKIIFWNISINLHVKLVENPHVTQPNQSQVIKVNLFKVS